MMGATSVAGTVHAYTCGAPIIKWGSCCTFFSFLY